MTNVSTKTATTRHQPIGRLRAWQGWVGYAATAWSLLYGLAGLYWAFGGAGFPFGRAGDIHHLESNLGSLAPQVGAVLLAVLGLGGAVVGLLMTRAHWRLRVLLLTYAGLLALILLLVVPDRRLLMLTAYTPLLAGVGLWTLLAGSSMPAIDQAWWTLANQVYCVLGGFLWLGAGVAYARRLGLRPPGWMAPGPAGHWGRVAVGIAVVTPLLYASTRWAWALGFRLGISEEFYQQGAREGAWWAGAALATLGIGGAILTLGLVQRWGEVYPRLIWWRRGCPIPPMLAVVPASIVSVMVTTAGIEYWRLLLTNSTLGDLEATWATMGPELLWPLWGAALAAATLAYYLRRSSTRASTRVPPRRERVA